MQHPSSSEAALARLVCLMAACRAAERRVLRVGERQRLRARLAGLQGQAAMLRRGILPSDEEAANRWDLRRLAPPG